MRSLVNGARFLVVFLAMTICSMAVSAQGAAQSPPLAPTGPYSVGRTSFDWTDGSRVDADNPNGHRELMVWVWYPAALKAGAETTEWMPGKWGELFWTQYVVKRFGSNGEKLNAYPMNTIHAHAYADAAIVSGKKKFSLLMFEPGLGDTPFIYATMIEDLASHGYVVAAVVPTYYTEFTVFSDGRAVVAQRTRPPFPAHVSDKRTSPDQVEFRKDDGTTVYLSKEQATEMRDGREKILNEIFHVWNLDMSFALTQMEKLNVDRKSQFRGRLDLNRVGAFGHSFGGASSLQVAKDDARVKAAIDLDGTMFGNVLIQGLFKPLLLFYHPLPEDRRPPAGQDPEELVFRDGKPSYRLTMAGSTHHFSADFGLLPFVTEHMKAQMGSIDPTRALVVTKAYVEAFFGEYLEGEKSPLLDRPSPEFPEIKFETNQSK